MIARSPIGACWAGMLACLAAAPALAQRTIENAPADYRHRGTDTPFPPRIGAFERGRVIEYSGDGRDASASYDLPRDGGKVMTVTVFLYPAPRGKTACRDQFAETVAALREAHPAAIEVASDTTPSPAPSVAPAGAHVAFTSTARFDAKDQPVRTDAWLFCPTKGRWLVKYRATGLRQASYDADVADFMRRFAWSSRVGR